MWDDDNNGILWAVSKPVVPQQRDEGFHLASLGQFSAAPSKPLPWSTKWVVVLEDVKYGWVWLELSFTDDAATLGEGGAEGGRSGGSNALRVESAAI